MAHLVYLQIPGIPGDATDPAHRDWIEVTWFEAGATAPRDAATGQSSGKRRHEPVKIRTPIGKANAPLFKALTENKKLARLLFEFIYTDSDGKPEVDYRLTLEDVLVSSMKTISPYPGDGGKRHDAVDSEDYSIVEFTYGSRRDEALKSDKSLDAWTQANKAQPADGVALAAASTGTQSQPKRPAAHAVARANATAASEHSTINLRPPKFFELALPVLTGEGGKRIYPPENATLRLVSRSGYNRSYNISEGMITDDQYCSFRFYDISEKQVDEPFTATLERAGQTETIFKDRRVATYIQAAREKGKYETTFAPPPVAQAQPQARDELLAPVAGSDAV